MRARFSLSVLLIVCALAVFVLPSCAADPRQSDPTGLPSEEPAVSDHAFGGAQFVVEAPFSTATLSIEADGQVVYTASSRDDRATKVSGTKRVSPEGISRLKTTVREAGFFALDDTYPYQEGVSYEDGSTYTIEVTLDGEMKSVSCYESECPSRFKEVMETIRNIWGEEILEVGV